jgi:hypothetical protein
MSEANAKRLTVCLLTYNRMDYAKATIDGLFKHLVVPDDWSVYFHIADDGSPDETYIDELKAYILAQYRRSTVINQKGIMTGQSNSERGGYGKNFNLAMQSFHDVSDYVMPIEDDWVLQKDLDVAHLCKLFDDVPEVGCIRLGYLSYTQPLYGTVIASNSLKYLLLDEESPEPHLFAGHPRIETVEWEKLVGPWPENLQPGDTEFYVATKLARKGIAWPMDLTRTGGDLFVHIGSERSY